ncbi:hypothetical protein C8Q80DRAFT_403870 [Daedaleopsis nitida]|nr:hypothetical protein C8Q80DRAFT_403870 [Daedaleopsis nitida]
MAASSRLALTQDILYVLAEHMDPDLVRDDALAARQALGRCAMAWSSFTEPALKVLWRSLPDDAPLVSLLFTLGIAPIITSCPSGASSPDIHTHPTWDRFRAYTSRVRRMRLDPCPRQLPQRRVWKALLVRMGGEAILPLLHTVDVQSGWPGSAPLNVEVLSLISSSVKSMSWHCVHSGPSLRNPFHRVCAMLTRLETLSIHAFDLVHNGTMDIGILKTCTRLRDLTVFGPPLDMKDLVPLTDLPAMKTLSITMSPRVWEEMIAFFQHAHLPQLQSLTLTANHHHDRSRFILRQCEAFRALVACVSSLTDLTINIVVYKPLVEPSLLADDSKDEPLAISSLVEPLLCLHHDALRRLCLRVEDVSTGTSYDIRR